MSPSHKDRAEMTPEELAAEKVYQEELFDFLTEHLTDEPIPVKRVSIWQRIKRVPGSTIGLFVRWFLIVVLVSIIVKLFIALVSI